MGYKLSRRGDGDVWHIYFIDREGLRVRRTTKQTDKRRAEIVADDLYRRHADPTYQAANATTIADAGRNLILVLEDRGRSRATIEKFYPVKLSHLGRVMGKDLPLARITARAVDDYIATRKEEGAHKYTISKELTALRQLLKVARRRGEFDKEVSQVMPVGFATGYEPRKRRLTIAEARRFIEALPPNVRRYVAFVCATTARDAAVGRARGRHLHSTHIEVFDHKTDASTRDVPLNAMTRPFAEYAFADIGPDDPVCPGISSVRHAFDRATKRLGMAHVSPNDLRRSVAHWLLERRVPRAAAAAFMGHANTKMLDMVYGKLDAKELGAEIALSLHPADDDLRAVDAVPVLTAGGPISSDDACGQDVEERSESEDHKDVADAESLEKQCAETESNRRHGDFQSAQTSGERSANIANSTPPVDGSWKTGPESQNEAPAGSGGDREAGDVGCRGEPADDDEDDPDEPWGASYVSPSLAVQDVVAECLREAYPLVFAGDRRALSSLSRAAAALDAGAR